MIRLLVLIDLFDLGIVTPNDMFEVQTFTLLYKPKVNYDVYVLHHSNTQSLLKCSISLMDGAGLYKII